MKYKYRAECEPDVLLFARSIHDRYAQILKVEPLALGLPDVVVTFKSTRSLDELIALSRSLEDCHVIAETLQLADLYTGERVSTL